MKDYYKILGVPRTATAPEIKNAYRKLSLLYHPDRNNGEEKFNVLFSEINEAYQVLYKNGKRSQYDHQYNNRSSQQQAHNQTYQQEQSYIQPIIEYFFVDKIYFRPGDVVMITWNTLYADSVELRPFGFVAAQGIKKIKINQSNPFIEINLIALNQTSRRYYTSKITLENVQYSPSKNNSKPENPLFDDKNSLRRELFSFEGKIGRFSYFKRMFSIVFILLFLSPFIAIPTNYSSGPLIFLIIPFFILAIIQSIKRLNALQWSWYYCVLFLIPYLNIIALLVLFIVPSSSKRT